MMTAEEPGRRVEWSISKRWAPLGRAVRVCEFIVTSDCVGPGGADGGGEVPISAPGVAPFRASAVSLEESASAFWGVDVGFDVTGVYVIPPISMGLESAADSCGLDLPCSVESLSMVLLDCS